jgi:hypothetical protein
MRLETSPIVSFARQPRQRIKTHYTMKVTNFMKTALLALAGLALATSAAQAAVTYAQDDLILGVRSTGTTEFLIVNLGSAANYAAATSNITIPTVTNIDAQLKAVFGSGWNTDATLSWGLVAGIPSSGTAVGSDSAKTVYLGKPESPLYTQGSTQNLSSSAKGTISGKIDAVGGQFASYNAMTGSNGAAFRQPNTDSPSSNWGAQVAVSFGAGTAFQEASDAAGIDNTIIDLFRWQGTNTTNTSTYEGSFQIGSNGDLTYSNTVPTPAAVPEPSRALLVGAAFGALALRRRRVA